MRAASLVFLLALLLAVVCGGCAKGRSSEQLDLDLIEVSPDVRLRTDTVGEGKFTATASFVLVDATNRAPKGAYVTLGGELVDAGGAALGPLNLQSLWIPAGETRTFALVDSARQPRPASTAVTLKVRGALVPNDPPKATIADLHQFTDQGRPVVQANLVNGAARVGTVMVIAAFHDAQNRPLTRPFSMVPIGAGETKPVQFVGPTGAVRGTVFVGDVVY